MGIFKSPVKEGVQGCNGRTYSKQGRFPLWLKHGFCTGLLTLCGALGEFFHISKPQLPRHGADNHSTFHLRL